MAPQAFRAGMSLTGTSVHVVHEAGCRDLGQCSEIPIQPRHLHDQRLVPVELRLLAEYGIDETFGIEAQVPFRWVKTTIDYTTPDGAPYTPLDAGVHHRDETIGGPADPWLLLRAGATVGEWWVAVRPGVTVPIGRTERNPFALGDRGLRHQHIQVGSGTFDPVMVAEASRRIDSMRFDAFVQGQVSLYENLHGYRAPWRVYGGASLGTKITGGLSGAIGPEAFHEDAERWDGRIRQDGNLGRTELLAALSSSLTLDSTRITVMLRAPLWRHVIVGDEPPGSLSSPLTVGLAVSHLFGAASVR